MEQAAEKESRRGLLAAATTAATSDYDQITGDDHTHGQHATYSRLHDSGIRGGPVW